MVCHSASFFNKTVGPPLVIGCIRFWSDGKLKQGVLFFSLTLSVSYSAG